MYTGVRSVTGHCTQASGLPSTTCVFFRAKSAMDNVTDHCVVGRWGCKCEDTTENENGTTFVYLFWAGVSLVGLVLLLRILARTVGGAVDFVSEYVGKWALAFFVTETIGRYLVFGAVLFYRNSTDRDPGQWITDAGKEQVGVGLLVVTGTLLSLFILFYLYFDDFDHASLASTLPDVVASTERGDKPKPHLEIAACVTQNVFHLYAVLLLLSPWEDWSRSTVATVLYAVAVAVNIADRIFRPPPMAERESNCATGWRVLQALVSEGANVAALGYTAWYLKARPCGDVPHF